MEQPLKQFQEDGDTYFQLYIPCPMCDERGYFRSFWTHYDNNCHGDIYVGDNAYFKCVKCGYSAHVKDWRFLCPRHLPDWHGGFEMSAISNSTCIISVIGVVGQMASATGVAWLQKFLANMGEW